MNELLLARIEAGHMHFLAKRGTPLGDLPEASVLQKTDAGTGTPLVDAILDQAEQKGTGRWTSQDALDLGVPLTGITEASKIVAYAQGFAQMRAASQANDWGLDLGAMATIWRGGCIIRAQFLNRISEAYDEHGDIENLMMVPYFTQGLAEAQDAWRRVVVAATEQGVAIPAFSSSLSYYDGYRRERGPANLIQGLRDYFGAHTYRRLDGDGSYHTRWGQDGAEVRTDG